MSDVAFYASLIVNGEILGCTFGDAPEVWESALGDDYLDDRKKGRMRRDYGLVEVAFQRVDQLWQCTAISCQIHRLKSAGTEAVSPRLVEEYGGFGNAVSLEDLSACVTQTGAHLELSSDGRPGEFSRLLATGTNDVRAEVVVVTETENALPAAVWSISVSGAPRTSTPQSED